MHKRHLIRSVLLLAATTALAALPPHASAQGRPALDTDGKRAYNKLVGSVPAAKSLGKDAVAILVFPKITKAGFVIGGQGITTRSDTVNAFCIT